MTSDTPRYCVARVTTMPFEALAPLAAAPTAARVRQWLDAERRLDAEAATLGEELFRLAGPPAAAVPDRARERTALLALRRDLHHRRTPRAGVAALPQPLATRFAEHVARMEAHRRETESLSTRVDLDIVHAERAVIETMSEPLAAEAMRLVGRSLLAKLRRAAAIGPDEWRHEQHQVAEKAVAYLGRFTTKTSPNGVFCATARAEFRGEGATVRGENRFARVQVRLNVGEARKVAACLAADPALESIVVPRANPTLRRAKAGWTYWKPATLRNADDDEIRAEVRDHPLLAAFLAEAEPRKLTVPELIAAAAARCGLDPNAEATRRFYRKLVDQGLLIAELEIPWSAWRPLAELGRACRGAGAGPWWIAEAEAIERAVDALDDRQQRERFQELDAIETRFERLPHVRPLATDDLLRADAATALEISLPESVHDELSCFMRTYARFYAAMYPAPLYRAGMVRKFLSRHPADVDVELLDVYHGLFEPTAQSPVAAFPEPPAATTAFERFRDHFVSRAREAAGADEITVSEAEWEGLLGDQPVPAYSCGVLFQVVARDLDSLAAGRWRACLNAVYPGGGLSVSRLASLHRASGEKSSWIEDELRRGHRWLERDEAVVAEVSFMHAARTANAGLRPPLLAYEIELLGDLATPGVNVIPVSDLVVRFDTASGEFHLRSRSLGIRVLPVVSSGISAEGLVSFLVEIGRQGTQPLAYFPGFDLDGVSAWPRVRCGNVVLFRRRWRFTTAELPRAGKRRAEAATCLEVARWRDRHGLPRHVFVHTSDDRKPFYVDLEAPLFASQMLRSIPGAGRPAPEDAKAGSWALHVTEMLPAPDELWVRDAAGSYACEFLLHLMHPATAARSLGNEAESVAVTSSG